MKINIFGASVTQQKVGYAQILKNNFFTDHEINIFPFGGCHLSDAGIVRIDDVLNNINHITELENRERHNKNDILASDIIIEYELENKHLPPNKNKYVHNNSMLTTNHPKTYIFINISTGQY